MSCVLLGMGMNCNIIALLSVFLLKSLAGNLPTPGRCWTLLVFFLRHSSCIDLTVFDIGPRFQRWGAFREKGKDLDGEEEVG